MHQALKVNGCLAGVVLVVQRNNLKFHFLASHFEACGVELVDRELKAIKRVFTVLCGTTAQRAREADFDDFLREHRNRDEHSTQRECGGDLGELSSNDHEILLG